MNRINYQKEMEKIIEGHVRSGETPRLLLHSCCGPCSSAVLERLTDFFAVTVLYYNPCIHPREEYELREREQERLIAALPHRNEIRFLAGRYCPEEFFQAVKGHEGDPEGGERCRICYEQRLREAAKMAKEGGFDYFTTTLSVSPMKNAEALNAIGRRLAEEYEGAAYLFSDFKKKDGYKRSIELSREYGLYRQDYCGCLFSRRERQAD